MNYSEKSKEELLNELLELQQSFDAKVQQYEKKIAQMELLEEKGRKSEELFKKAFFTSPDSVNINRLSDGMFVAVNEGFTKILGFSEEESVGKTSLEMSIWKDPEDRKRMLSEITARKHIENFEAIFSHKNGREVVGLMSASFINIDDIPHILSVTKDISHRKNMNEALFREQFLVNALLNNITDHIYFKDRESKFIRINKSHALSFGLDDPSQAIGKSDFDFFPKEHALQAFEDEQKIIRTEESISKVEKHTRKNLPDSWSSSIKLPLRDISGNIIGTFGISRDITKQKKSEEQLFILANALKSINECVSITDMNDRVLFLNQAFLNTYGYNESDLKEESISLIRSPNNPPEIVREILPATISGGWRGELWNRRKDGSEFLVALSTASVRNDLGEPIALIGVASDITSRKRTELENQINYEITQGITTTSNLDELLELMHKSLSKVVYAENCFVALYDSKTELFSFPYFVDKIDSTPLTTTMEKSCTAYVFRTVKPLLLSQQLFDSLVEQNEVELIGSNSPSWIGIPLQSPSKIIGVLVLQHYEKENVYSELDIRFLNSIANHIAFAIERKISEEEILLKNELLQSLNTEKDKFFSIIAHDLRGPLSAFVAATQIISDEIQSMSVEEIREITKSMKTSATGIYSLLENLLEWSRMRRGGLDFIPENLNLKEKVNDYIKIFSESAKKKNISINVSIPDDIVVFADNHMFDAIIRNLVSNAVKFTPTGGNIFITTGLNINNFVEIKITDSGIGISQELMAKLFQISEKTSRKGTEGESSTGLGLLLVNDFIEKHGGQIWIESEVGKGTTFKFTIERSK